MEPKGSANDLQGFRHWLKRKKITSKNARHQSDIWLNTHILAKHGVFILLVLYFLVICFGIKHSLNLVDNLKDFISCEVVNFNFLSQLQMNTKSKSKEVCLFKSSFRIELICKRHLTNSSFWLYCFAMTTEMLVLLQTCIYMHDTVIRKGAYW